MDILLRRFVGYHLLWFWQNWKMSLNSPCNLIRIYADRYHQVPMVTSALMSLLT
jgi:hypothetical protein